MLTGYRERFWDDSMKVVGIFGALPGSKELLLLVRITSLYYYANHKVVKYE